MKLRLALCLLCLCSCGLSLAEEKPKPARKKLSKTAVHVRVAQKPRALEIDTGIADVYTAPGYATMIELPEDIKQFAEGDAKRWVIACGVDLRPGVDAGGKDLCAVKPGKPEDLDEHVGKQSTSVTVIGVSGAIYPFHLVPADQNNPVDLVTFVRSASRRLVASADPAEAAMARSAVAACESDQRLVKVESAGLRRSLEADRRLIEGLVDPRRVAFDYKVSRSKGLFGRRKIQPVMMFHDDHRTFLRVSGSPVVHSGGKDLTPTCADGLCVVSGVLDKGYFVSSLGRRKTSFQRKTKATHHA